MVTVTLAGKAYTIAPLPIRKNKEWRKKFQAPLDEVIAILQGAGTIALMDDNKSINVTSIANLVGIVKNLLLGSVDILIEALFAYAPALQAEKEWLEENATDEEAIEALIEVLKLAYPLGKLQSLLPSAGSPAQPTMTNSPSPSGASGSTS